MYDDDWLGEIEIFFFRIEERGAPAAGSGTVVQYTFTLTLTSTRR